MRRRAFLASTIGLATLPGLASAQVAARVPRVGWISPTSMRSATPLFNAFRGGLAGLGYVEGQNIQIEARYGDDVSDRLPALAEELLRIPVDVVMTHGPAARIVVKHLTALPVVYVVSGDPVEGGLAKSLARPGGNSTGITLLSVELNGKRLELLREIVPTLRNTAIIANPFHLGEHLERLECEQTAQRLGITIQYLPVRDVAELEASFAAIAEGASEAIVVFPDPLAIGNRQRIIDFGMARRIPVISGWDIFARSGALCTYGPKLAASYQRVAYYVHRILNGTKPAELPIERPTVFELIVNMKTANALGLTIPPSVLIRADEVID